MISDAKAKKGSTMRSAERWAEFIWNNCRVERATSRQIVYGEDLSIKDVVDRIQKDALASCRAICIQKPEPLK